MKNIIATFQIITSFLLIMAIILQPKGEGLNQSFGNNEFYKTKRGMEKALFIITIILIFSFLILSITNFLIK